MIRVYEPGDLSSGFVGIRVAVSVNAKLKQKYWSRNRLGTEFAMEHAIEHEQKLLKKQAEYFNERVFSKSSNTGISGLQMSLDICRKKYGVYLYNRLVYQFRKGDKSVTKSMYIKDYNITDDQWFEMCRIIKNARICKNETFDKMLAKKPTEAKIRKEFERIHEVWRVNVLEEYHRADSV